MTCSPSLVLSHLLWAMDCLGSFTYKIPGSTIPGNPNLGLLTGWISGHRLPLQSPPNGSAAAGVNAQDLREHQSCGCSRLKQAPLEKTVGTWFIHPLFFHSGPQIPAAHCQLVTFSSVAHSRVMRWAMLTFHLPRKPFGQLQLQSCRPDTQKRLAPGCKMANCAA